MSPNTRKGILSPDTGGSEGKKRVWRKPFGDMVSTAMNAADSVCSDGRGKVDGLHRMANRGGNLSGADGLSFIIMRCQGSVIRCMGRMGITIHCANNVVE